jgi:glycosyltransferase involved in cell wall biosynthesis
MRIAFVVINANRREGTSRAIVEVAERLGKNHQVSVFSRTAESVDHSRFRWERVVCPSWPDVAEFEGFRVNAERRLRRHHFDIIHSAGCNVRGADVYAIQTVHPSKMRVNAVQSRDGKTNALRRWTRRLYDEQVVAAERACYVSRNDRGIVGYLPVSQGTRRELEGHYPLGGALIEMIPNGADIEHFHPRSRETVRGPIRRDFGVDDAKVVFLFAGGEWRRKGLELALRSIAASSSRQAMLVVAGDDPQRGEFHRIADELTIQDRVRWLGFRRDIADLYAAADAFLFPSSYEAFSLATIEAAASGLPVVMCDISGAEELLGDGYGGVIVDRDVAALARVIDDLANDDRKRKVLGEQARAKVERRFTWDRIAAETERFYESLLALRSTNRTESADVD